MSANRLALVLVAIELVVATTIAAHGALTFERRMSALDEPAHMSYVELVAREHRLPVLGEDLTSTQGHRYRIGDQTSEPPPPTAGLGAFSYEAFQPPLYYLVAGGIYEVLPGSYETKFRLLRLTGVGWLLVTAALTVALARAVRPRAWPWIAAVACSTLTLPGVAVRFVAISNATIEPVVVTATVLLSWLAATKRSGWLLAAAAGGLGAATLTKVTLLAIAPAVAAAAIVIAWHGRSLRIALPALLVAPALVAPWLLWNQATYDRWTANEQAEDMQRAIVNPDGVDFDLYRTATTAVETQLWSVPQETTPYVRSLVSALLWTITVLVLVVPAMLFGRGSGGWTSAAILLGPLLAITAVHAGIMYIEDWPALLARYVVPALPAWGVAAGLTYERAGHRLARRAVIVIVLAAVALWVWCLTTPPWGG